MTPSFWRIVLATIAMVVALPWTGRAQAEVASWLDDPESASWNESGAFPPAAPEIQGPVDPGCREQARPPQLDEDRRVREQGWDLVGAEEPPGFVRRGLVW